MNKLISKLIICMVALSVVLTAHAQSGPASGSANGQTAVLSPAQQAALVQRQANLASAALKQDTLLREQIQQVNQVGIPTQIETIAHYRGARGFQLSGIGLVIGLENTGDTKKSVLTQDLYANYFRSHNLSVDSTTVQAQNVALVQVSALMPAFTKPGTLIDVTVSSIADAKSLQGGTLILTPLYSPADNTSVVASAQGPLSIGGFNASANGSSVQQNAVNVGRVPGGAEVQMRINSQVVFKTGSDQTLYLDLDEPDPNTINAVAKQIRLAYPEVNARTVDDTTVSITIPQAEDPETLMSDINMLTVNVMIPAKVVINERTGTIVVGGEVSLGPAMIVSGNLNVRIDTTNQVVQPNSFSQGVTANQSNSSVSASQETAKVTVLPSMSTVADLAKIFQALNLKPNDVIQILQLLHQQGALKAKIELQ